MLKGAEAFGNSLRAPYAGQPAAAVAVRLEQDVDGCPLMQRQRAFGPLDHSYRGGCRLVEASVGPARPVQAIEIEVFQRDRPGVSMMKHESRAMHGRLHAQPFRDALYQNGLPTTQLTLECDQVPTSKGGSQAAAEPAGFFGRARPN